MYSSTVIARSIVVISTKNYFPSISLCFLVVLLQFYQQMFGSVIIVLFSMCFFHSWLNLKVSYLIDIILRDLWLSIKHVKICIVLRCIIIITVVYMFET